ncbi:DUF4179 domain-containing protein [Clostridium tertium]|uniref:DUF4179 domain-containing protein n=1 Tax=Clostridium tertium TaxID=1559 RepID=A0A6N3FDC8_9CLOT
MNNYNEDKFNEILKHKAKQENIQAPERLKKNVLNTLNKLPDRKVKRKSRLSKVSGLVAGLIICLLTFNMFMPAYAESLPVIGPTFKEINEAIGIGDKYVKGSKDVDITKKYKDTTMTINNIYYDGVELAIAYELKSESGFDDKPIVFPIIRSGFKGIQYDNEENNGEFIDDNTYVGLASYSFTNDKLPDKAKIEFIVNDLYGNWVGYYPKKLDFKFSIDSKDMGKEVYTINKDIKYGEESFKVKEVIKSKLNTVVYVDVYNEHSKANKYYQGDYLKEYNFEFIALDDKGIPLNNKGMEFSSVFKAKKLLIGTSIFRFDEISEETKSITLIPIISNSNRMSIVNNTIENVKYTIEKINKDKETLIESNSEEYIINNIDFQEDKTVVNLKAKKYLRTLEDINISIWDEEKLDKYNNSNKGQEYEWYKGTTDIEIKNTKFNGLDDGYNFTLTLPALDKNKDYYIAAPNRDIKVLENERITIDLSKN